MSDIEAKVKAIIAKELSVSEDKIGPSSSFVDDLGADSLDQVELMMAFEEAFDLKEISSEDAEKLRTVSDAVEYLTGKV